MGIKNKLINNRLGEQSQICVYEKEKKFAKMQYMVYNEKEIIFLNFFLQGFTNVGVYV